MDTQNSSLSPSDDHRPLDQHERAATAQSNPNDPAVSAANSPNYGEFNKANTAATTNDTPAGRDGSNDNPDEFSEFRDREKDAQEAPANPADQPGHVEQNQDPAAVRATQNDDNDEQRAAWAKDDPRYASGGTHNTRSESASTKDNQE